MSISSSNEEVLLAKPPEREESRSTAREGAKGRRHLRPIVFFVAVPLLILLMFYSPNIDGRVDLYHEGESLAPASEEQHGKLPFRDVYLQHGWGVNLLRAKLAFALFGESIASIRKLTYGPSGYLIPLAWIGIYLLLYSLFRNKLWIIPAFALLAFGDVMVNDRHLLPFLSLSLLALGRSDRRWPFFFSGALAAAAFFYSLDTGIYAAAIGAVFILVSSAGSRSYTLESFQRVAAPYLMGVLAGALPFAFYLLWRGILGDFLLNCYLQLRYQTETWGVSPPSIAALLGPFENATERNRTFYLVIKWYYPLFVYACIFLLLAPRLLRRGFREGDRILLLVAVTGITFYRSAIGRADESHLMFAIAPFWILNICFLERAFIETRNRTGRSPGEANSGLSRFERLSFSYFSIALAALGLALYFWATCRNGGIVARRAKLAFWRAGELSDCVTLAIERGGGIKVPGEQAEEIEKTVEFITSHVPPEEPIFDFSNQGAYYFFSDRLNSTSYCQAAYAMPRELQARVVGELRRSPPSLILLREDAFLKPRQKEPIIYDWIQKHYREAGRIGSNVLLLPLQKGEGEPSDSGPVSP